MLGIALVCGSLTAPVTQAQVRPPLEPALPPPSPTGSEEDLQPEVTIIRRQDRTIEEYSVNGQLYMIKVTPKRGRPYFLVDSDGNGNFDMQRVAGPDLEPRMLIPSWVLLRW
jgi:hypothetical protein